MSETSESQDTAEVLEEFEAESPSPTSSEERNRPEAPERANMTTIKIGDAEYPIFGAKRVVSDTAEQVLYSKDERKNLSTC
jgi:hypothetical protein